VGLGIVVQIGNPWTDSWTKIRRECPVHNFGILGGKKERIMCR